MERFFRKKLNEKGFTLVELMIVVVIIGMLSSLVVFAVGDKVDEAKINKAKADIQTVNSALELYYIEKSEYPDVSDYEGLKNELVDKYLKELPEPVVGYEYHYKKDTGKVTCPQIDDNGTGGSK